jgi:peptidoglycan/LPS O-acetylase OafA/YrhL
MQKKVIMPKMGREPGPAQPETAPVLDSTHLDFPPYPRHHPRGVPAGLSEGKQPAAVGRLPELDALRGLAALAVLVFHTLHAIGSGRNPVWLEQHQLLYILITHSPLRPVFFGREAVLFFFVLSGYVLTRSLLRAGSPGLVAFAFQRTIRLGLPVAATVLLSAALYWLVVDPATPNGLQSSLGLWRSPPTLGDIVTNIGLIGADDQFELNQALWSLVHEWRLTVLLPLVLLFRERPWALLAVALVATALGMAGGAIENEVLLGPSLSSTIPATLYFSTAIAIGGVLAITVPFPFFSPGQRITAGIAAAALFSMQSDFAVYAGSVLLILLAHGTTWLPRLLRTPPLIWLGRLSFSLYLVHMPVLAACRYALHDLLPMWAAVLVGATAALPAAVFLHRLIEVPSRRLARWVETAVSRIATRF